MKEGKSFTPGPWRALRNSAFWQINDANDDQIGDTCASSASPEHGGSEELGCANATMMAAAPDLFEALEKMTARYVELAGSGDCGFWNPETDSEVIQARAALARCRVLGAAASDAAMLSLAAQGRAAGYSRAGVTSSGVAFRGAGLKATL